ncbi:glycosyltransferase family 4 protein [Roseomonas sp. NAR14]|uniref:Glycosyltransferase family 4 protein n=1 Tax=Roseomonas acroporae TaxID=2937791 RepID=A0A9X2BZ85_9PROT|nr:glycosyltransferase family 4 protein [Roseomonas acroporae]MCK8786795.1 glycosyltransferase family 4 protein [Roseomonas acroporae]
MLTGPLLMGPARFLVRNFLPQRGREMVRDLAVALRVPSAAPPPPTARTVTICGLLTSPTGIGEGARLAARLLAENGWRVGLLDMTAMFAIPTVKVDGMDHPNMEWRDLGGPLIVHLNPPEFQIVLFRLGLSGRGRRLIGNWVWELPIVPPVWRKAFRLPHEVWAPSRFVADSLRRSGFGGPVRLIPYPVTMPDPATLPPRAPADSRRFTVLLVFAFDSGYVRKNPLAAVAAFRRAFGDRTDVELVIKTRGSTLTGRPERELAEAVAGAPNIRLTDATLRRDEYVALLAGADVYLSLHRAEGFGIPLAEAMLLGTPVVATGWSGNVDFMAGEDSCLVPAAMIRAEDDTPAYRGLRSEWADPSVEAAADWLRRLEADPALRRRIGEAGRARVAAMLGPEAVARRMVAALEAAPGEGLAPGDLPGAGIAAPAAGGAGAGRAAG